MTKISTGAKPYHFVESGLANVYLVGVEYGVAGDGLESASIPCLPQLMELVGRVLALKQTPLTPDEVRFLRKRLRLASKRFAVMVGLSSETYSRIEHGAARITPTVERVIRLLYATLAPLSEIDSVRVASMTWPAEVNPAQRILAHWHKADGWMISGGWR